MTELERSDLAMWFNELIDSVTRLRQFRCDADQRLLIFHVLCRRGFPESQRQLAETWITCGDWRYKREPRLDVCDFYPTPEQITTLGINVVPVTHHRRRLREIQAEAFHHGRSSVIPPSPTDLELRCSEYARRSALLELELLQARGARDEAVNERVMCQARIIQQADELLRMRHVTAVVLNEHARRSLHRHTDDLVVHDPLNDTDAMHRRKLARMISMTEISLDEHAVVEGDENRRCDRGTVWVMGDPWCWWITYHDRHIRDLPGDPSSETTVRLFHVARWKTLDRMLDNMENVREFPLRLGLESALMVG